jgi:hypothetical protein
MKLKYTLIAYLFLYSLVAFAQQPFITTWTSVFSSTSISFGTVITDAVAYSWETLPPAAALSGSVTFVGPTGTIIGLPADARIRLTIQPESFKRIFGSGTAFTIVEISQWGNVEWISMENAFDNSNSFFTNGIQLVTAIDIPNLTNVTSMKDMFKNCTNFNPAISSYNTSNVADMSSMFEGAQNLIEI